MHQTLIPPDLLRVLYRAWTQPFTTRCDFARENAEAIALCACEHLLTTRTSGNSYSNIWKIAPDGLDILKDQGYSIVQSQEEE